MASRKEYLDFILEQLAYLLNCENEKLPTETIFAFES